MTNHGYPKIAAGLSDTEADRVATLTRLVDCLESLSGDDAAPQHGQAETSLTIARHGLREAIADWLSQTAETGAREPLAHAVLRTLPSDITESILLDRPGAPVDPEMAAIWKGCFAAHVPTLAGMPDDFFRRSRAAITALCDLGFDYEARIGPYLAAELWLSRGRDFGAPILERTHPVTSPTIVYWRGAARGFAMPPGGLCDDGVAEIGDTIRLHAGGRLPRSVTKKVQQDNIDHHDWRVVAALMSGDVNITQGCTRMVRAHLFGRERSECLDDIFRPAETAHDAMRKRMRRLRLPDPETLLRLPDNTPPSFLDPFLT